VWRKYEATGKTDFGSPARCQRINPDRGHDHFWIYPDSFNFFIVGCATIL